MPLSHSQTFEGFGYGGCGSSDRPSLQSKRQKRKIMEETLSEKNHASCEKKTDDHVNIPKRHCQRLTSAHQAQICHQKFDYAEDVNMEDEVDIPESESHFSNDEVLVIPQNERHISNDEMFSNCCQHEVRGLTESSTSMDADSLLVESHMQTTCLVSSPHSMPQETIRRPLKTSPVSVRPFCHCSASWRGMYGLDIGYITDYY